jgi:hypothetical protein
MTGGDTDVPKSTSSWEVFLNSDERGNQDLVENEFWGDSHTENVRICRESLEFVVLFLFRCQKPVLAILKVYSSSDTYEDKIKVIC